MRICRTVSRLSLMFRDQFPWYLVVVTCHSYVHLAFRFVTFSTCPMRDPRPSASLAVNVPENLSKTVPHFHQSLMQEVSGTIDAETPTRVWHLCPVFKRPPTSPTSRGDGASGSVDFKMSRGEQTVTAACMWSDRAQSPSLKDTTQGQLYHICTTATCKSFQVVRYCRPVYHPTRQAVCEHNQGRQNLTSLAQTTVELSQQHLKMADEQVGAERVDRRTKLDVS